MENKPTCPICETPLQNKNEQLTTGDRQYFDCPRCGKYEASRSLLSGLPNLLTDEEKKAILSHHLRKMQAGKEIPILNSYTIERVLQKKFPSLSEQIDNIIQWLGANFKPGDIVERDIYSFQSIMGTATSRGANFILHHIYDDELINIPKFSPKEENYTIKRISLSFKGWKHYENITRGLVKTRKAFMAMKFGNEELDQIFLNYFKPAVRETGFDLFRLDEEPKAGLIDDRLRVEIRNSKFLISDLTHENAGAYWEAGFAEGLGMPVIYTCEKTKFESQKTHFDTNHHLTIVWDKDYLDEAVNQLKATIRATLPDEAKLIDDVA